MWASDKGHKETVEMLLQEKNIDVNHQDFFDSTALILASSKGHKETNLTLAPCISVTTTLAR